MEDTQTPLDGTDRIDPIRTLFLGVCTTALFVAFLLLLIGDHVSATSF